jgi:hypothetical protein
VAGREEVQLEELPVEQRVPILRAYLQRASFWSITLLVRSSCGTCPRCRFLDNVTSEGCSEH